MLNSGNELTGQFEFADTDKVVINSWYVGRLEFKRSTIKAMILAKGGGGRVTFNGPTASEGWVFSTARNVGEKGVIIQPRPIQGILPRKNAPSGKFWFKANSLETSVPARWWGEKLISQTSR